MRWTAFSLGAVLALAGTTYGSYGSNVMVGGAIGGMLKRRTQEQNDSAGAILEARQGTEGRCGADQGNAKCPANQCCSQWGYCGVGAEFCNPIALCQSAFGSCLGSNPTAAPAPTSSAAPPPVTTTTPVVVPTTTSRVAPPPTTTPAPPRSSTTTPAPPPPTSTSARPPPASSPPAQPSPVGHLTPSTNGQCGNSTTCSGSGHGSCCSEFYYCGDGIEYCGAGCQSNFGLCFGGVAAAPPPVSNAPLTPSTNGMCGNTTTCAGSGHGSCCSEYFHCGDGAEFCAAGCQSRFGLCFGGAAAAPAPAAPSRAPASSASSAAPSRAPASSAAPSAAAPSSAAPRPSTTAAAAPPASARPSSTAAAAAPSAAPALPAGVSVTTDGSCGGGKTCLGSTFGQCCSQFGFCGDGDQFCPYIVSCQPQWGHCDPAPAGASVN